MAVENKIGGFFMAMENKIVSLPFLQTKQAKV